MILDFQAAILHDLQPGVAGALRRHIVHDKELRPEHIGASGDGLFRNSATYSDRRKTFTISGRTGRSASEA